MEQAQARGQGGWRGDGGREERLRSRGNGAEDTPAGPLVHAKGPALSSGWDGGCSSTTARPPPRPSRLHSLLPALPAPPRGRGPASRPARPAPPRGRGRRGLPACEASTRDYPLWPRSSSWRTRRAAVSPDGCPLLGLARPLAPTAAPSTQHCTPTPHPAPRRLWGEMFPGRVLTSTHRAGLGCGVERARGSGRRSEGGVGNSLGSLEINMRGKGSKVGDLGARAAQGGPRWGAPATFQGQGLWG